jgi:hypothetical protein
VARADEADFLTKARQDDMPAFAIKNSRLMTANATLFSTLNLRVVIKLPLA